MKLRMFHTIKEVVKQRFRDDSDELVGFAVKREDFSHELTRVDPTTAL